MAHPSASQGFVTRTFWPIAVCHSRWHPLGTHLDLATVARVSLRAAALEAANVIDAFAGILTWIRFAFIILKVAQFAGEACRERERGIEMGFVSTKLACTALPCLAQLCQAGGVM